MNRAGPRSAGRVLAWTVLVVLLASAFARDAIGQEPALPDWIEVGYGELVDLRQPSHSGEPVETLLRRLGGRALSAAADRPADFATHRLLDPLLEPYAFVLPDALDSLSSTRGTFFVEVGSLWPPAAAQPAWVELLRARRFLVESDGAGQLRLFLPWSGNPASATESSAAARAAYGDAWPVLRHVLAAERRRLAEGKKELPALDVLVYPYVHRPARALFLLGTQPARMTVEETRPEGTRPPLNIDGLRQFLKSGLLLEGARIEQNGSLRWLGSRKGAAARILGRPVELADLAVAYRAVFHGGLAEPYMSLDKGYWPQTSVVNYGGRLRDTALGMVSLLCDIRFKTFSQGIDIRTGSDMRETLRGRLPGFMTHLEHLAYDERSARTATQQTRLWFYPDKVDLTVSAQGDVLVLRKVRMSAASERFDAGSPAAGDVPPWTRATVAAINTEYDGLSDFFPEMADLDNVVRVLSLFTWLRHVEAGGHLVPELDSLLSVELPQQPTPRTLPQLLAFNALPQPGTDGAVEVLERLDVVEGLERLNPLSGLPLPAVDRYKRVLAVLDPSNAEQAALLQRLAGVKPEQVPQAALDDAAYQSQRLLMHDLVLTTLRGAGRDRVADRFRQGEQVRVFSVGIGGLDLGMEQVLARAQGGRMTLSAGGFGGATTLHGSLAAGSASEAGSVGAAELQPRSEWQVDPAGLPATTLPRHGFGKGRPGAGDLVRADGNRFEAGPPEGRKNRPAWRLAVYGEDGPEVRSRRVVFNVRGNVLRIERLERMRLLRYRMERDGVRLLARLLASPPAESGGTGEAATQEGALPAGLALMRLDVAPEDRGVSTAVSLRLEMNVSGVRRGLDADYPRSQLRRLVLGRDVDKTPDRPMSGFEPLPQSMADVETMMVLAQEAQSRRPWDEEPLLIGGEENPIRLAAALGDWWAAGAGDTPRAVVGVDSSRSPGRWDAAPRPGANPLLLLPTEGFPRGTGELEAELRRAWGSGAVATELPDRLESSLVLLVSAEAPGLFAARLRELAAAPALKGKLLAAWNLNGAMREDLPADLLETSSLAGVGLAVSSFGESRAGADRLAALRAALEGEEAPRSRVERLPGPFLWYF